MQYENEAAALLEANNLIDALVDYSNNDDKDNAEAKALLLKDILKRQQEALAKAVEENETELKKYEFACELFVKVHENNERINKNNETIIENNEAMHKMSKEIIENLKTVHEKNEGIIEKDEAIIENLKIIVEQKEEIIEYLTNLTYGLIMAFVMVNMGAHFRATIELLNAGIAVLRRKMKCFFRYLSGGFETVPVTRG